MKYIKLIIFFVLLNTSAFSKVLDQAIVIIENDVITQTEYQKRLRFILNQYQLSGQQPPQDKEAFYKQSELSLCDAYDYASSVMVENMLKFDAKEGIDAFIDKRYPNWEDK